MTETCNRCGSELENESNSEIPEMHCTNPECGLTHVVWQTQGCQAHVDPNCYRLSQVSKPLRQRDRAEFEKKELCQYCTNQTEKADRAESLAKTIEFAEDKEQAIAEYFS